LKARWFVSLVGLVCSASVAHAQVGRDASACPVSAIVEASAPRDPDADPIVHASWFINADRTIWVRVPEDGWPAGGRVYRGRRAVPGQKTYWVRPRGTGLQISGHRLDDSTARVGADIPCCYTTGFQIVALHFPTAGCWQVNARAGDHELTFVTQVRPPDGR
jgi:hypothetical protein